MKLLWHLCCFILLVTLSNSLLSEYYKFENVETLSADNYTEFVNATVVRSVYFYRKTKKGLHEGYQNLKSFFKEYDLAAKFLNTFQVKVAVIDCTLHPNIGPCSDPNAEDDVYVFKKGKEMVKLGLETMFDLDSIVANLLQLLMLKEVLILQTVADREGLLKDNIGKKNILFSYQKAMGTYEHRIFLESAFAYGDHYTFAISTELDGVVGLTDADITSIKKKNAEMWFIKCKDVKEGVTCPDTKYNGVMDILNVARYLKLLKNPFTFDIPHDGETAIYESQEIHMAFLMYDEESKDEVKETANKLGNIYFGTIGVVTVDVNKVDTTDRFEHNRAVYKPPVFALKLFGKKPNYMINRFSIENILKSVKAQLLVAEKEAHKMRIDAMPGNAIPSSTDGGFDDVVQTPDDEVAESVRKLNKMSEIDLSKIPALTDKTFPEMMTKSHITLVLFYIKFDPVSMAFLRSYAKAATSFSSEDMANPLARVECYDWTDVCGKQNITKYPTIQIYKKDKKPVEYKGILEGEKVIDYLRIHQVENPMKLSSKEMAVSFIEGSYPEKSRDYVDVLVVAGLTGRSNELTVMKEVADEFQGEFLFAYGVDSVAKDICSKYNAKLPCLVILKHNDPLNPSKVYNGEMESPEIVEFIKKNRLPIFTELTVENFPILYKQKKSLMLFFGDEAGNPQEFKALSDVAMGGVITNRLFAWVDVSNVDSIGTQILQTYSSNAQIPTIAEVDLEHGYVHLYHREQFEPDYIVEWIRDIEEHREWPEYIMPETKWPPLHPGYDFLNLMEGKDSHRMDQDEEYLAIANEHGIGFDADGNPIERKANDLKNDAEELISSRLSRPSKNKANVKREEPSPMEDHMEEMHGDEYSEPMHHQHGEL